MKKSELKNIIKECIVESMEPLNESNGEVFTNIPKKSVYKKIGKMHIIFIPTQKSDDDRVGFAYIVEEGSNLSQGIPYFIHSDGGIGRAESLPQSPSFMAGKTALEKLLGAK